MKEKLKQHERNHSSVWSEQEQQTALQTNGQALFNAQLPGYAINSSATPDNTELREWEFIVNISLWENHQSKGGGKGVTLCQPRCTWGNTEPGATNKNSKTTLNLVLQPSHTNMLEYRVGDIQQDTTALKAFASG